MKISIFGLGYVGAVSLACLARDGHQVVGVDIDPVKLGLIRQGRSPIVEQGMAELMDRVVASGRVTVTDDPVQALAQTELSFICVGTPPRSNGSQDQSAVLRLTEQLGKALAHRPDGHVIVYRSTLAPGTVEGTLRPLLERHSGKRDGENFHVCFQPEFLREGSSIKDYDRPPYTIVGARSERATARLQELFGHLPGEFLVSDIGTAETVKYFCNIFHALKITFANEVGRLCQSLEVDSRQVMQLLCQDTQLNISAAYLKPGFAFGGSCLPKDLRAMLHLAKTRDVEVPMLAGVLPSNQRHIQHAIDKVLASGRRRVSMLGLSFKSGTDDLRESPLVTLAEQFIGKGLDLKIYAPEVHLSRLLGANKRYIESTIPHIGALLTDDLDQVLQHGQVLVVGLNDELVARRLDQGLHPEQMVLDLVGLPQRVRVNCDYHGICW